MKTDKNFRVAVTFKEPFGEMHDKLMDIARITSVKLTFEDFVNTITSRGCEHIPCRACPLADNEGYILEKYKPMCNLVNITCEQVK